VHPLFGFIQFEFTHSIGPHAGRYVVERRNGRDEEDEDAPPPVLTRAEELTGVTRTVGTADILVMTAVLAPQAQMRLRRKSRYVQSGSSPDEVPLMLATYVKGTEPLDDKRRAAEVLDLVRTSEDEQERWITEGMEVINLAIRAYRAGARDPYVVEVTPRDARRTRIGYGSTEELRDGGWQAAVELVPPSTRGWLKRPDLRPSETIASVLAHRKPVLECEDVLVRAYIDLDHGRTRAAAQQVRGAMALLASELSGLDGESPGAGGAELDRRLTSAERLAETAVERPLAKSEIEELEGLLETMGKMLDAWRYGRE
jgi:hypothetical protein